MTTRPDAAGDTRPDPNIPQRQASDPGASVWVAASAGTGKTKVLTDRVLSILLTGTLPHRLLCLTFTKAAAAEMANRIAAKLAGWSTAKDAVLAEDLAGLLGRPPEAADLLRARRLFAQVLDAPGGMKILTIHSFCQSLLRRFPLEAGLAPHFSVMDDRDSAEIMLAAQEEVMSRARHGADDALAQALAEVTSKIHELKFPELMGELAGDRGRLKRLFARHGGLAGVMADLAARLGIAPGTRPGDIIAQACRDDAFAAADCRAAMAALAQGAPTDGKRAAKMDVFLAASAVDRVALWDEWCLVFLTTKGTLRSTQATKGAIKALAGVEDIMAAEADRILGVLGQWRAAVTLQATEALLTLGEALVAAYENHKSRRAQMDYDDLILAAGRLLNQPGAAAWVLFKLDGGIDHVLVDEAQDTNPDQWAVIGGLTQEFFAGQGARDETLARTIFAVGDAKQSIYSFQRADPKSFEDMRRHYAQIVPQAQGRWRVVPLQISFRSTRAVLDAVDAVFTRLPDDQAITLDGGEYPRHVSWRHQDGGLVEIWPPIEPRDVEEPQAWKPPIERVKGDSPRTRCARLIARKVRHMLDSGDILEAKGRTVQAGDVMVLVRRRGAFVEDLVRELKALHVPVAGADRMVLAEQMAVMDLMALGQMMLLPEDDLTLAVVLKGPLIGLTEDDLFRLAHGREAPSLWGALAARAGEAPYDAAYRDLGELLGLADYLTPHDFYAHLLNFRGGRRKLLARLGLDAEDPIDEFVSLTLAYEQSHAPSLQGFLHWLEAGAVEIKRDLEQAGMDAVRIMTVHGAKGLQAPIVFLPDTMQVPIAGPKLLWLTGEDSGGRESEAVMWPPRAEFLDPVGQDARDTAAAARDAEYRRLLYVALTRAEDRLYVCGWKTPHKSPPASCWYNLIKTGLDAEAEPATDAFLATQAADIDAQVLRLTCKQNRKPAAAKLRESRDRLDALPGWVHEAPESEPLPPKPLAPSRPDGEEPPVRSPLSGVDGAKFQRGTLVHRLLQTLPDLPRDKRAGAAMAFLGRPVWKLSAAERVEIGSEVAALLEDSAFAALFGPGSRAEVPVVGLVGDRVVSGQVDRLVVTPDEIIVVDYKTNRRPPKTLEGVPEIYVRQMAAYRVALACIYPGRRVRCALLWTDGPALMELPAKMLDDALHI